MSAATVQHTQIADELSELRNTINTLGDAQASDYISQAVVSHHRRNEPAVRVWLVMATERMAELRRRKRGQS